jgi:hypothetical protein
MLSSYDLASDFIPLITPKTTSGQWDASQSANAPTSMQWFLLNPDCIGITYLNGERPQPGSTTKAGIAIVLSLCHRKHGRADREFTYELVYWLSQMI